VPYTIEQEKPIGQIGDYRMIDTLHVENFRCFKSLDLSGLRRINIVVGKNASGKTVLLESIKMGMDGLPVTPQWLNALRGIQLILPPNATVEQFQALFLDFFHSFNLQTPIVIQMHDSINKSARLSMYFDPKRAVTAQALGFQGSPPSPITIVPLAFDRVSTQSRNVRFSAK
jgi:hypothetical protein